MSELSSDRYRFRGVSAQKEDVHNAIKNINKGLFPKAFCKIVPDHLTGQAKIIALVMHADGAGTKSSLAYAYWKETGDLVSLERRGSRCFDYEYRRPLLCVGVLKIFCFLLPLEEIKISIPGEVICYHYSTVLKNLLKRIKGMGSIVFIVQEEKLLMLGIWFRTIIVDSTVMPRSNETF